MASIKRRDGGKWQAQVRRRGYTPQTRTFSKKSDAEAWVRHLEGEIDRGDFVLSREAGRTTFGECLERYEINVTPTKRSVIAERSKIKFLRQHPLADRFMSTLRGADLAAFRDERLSVGLKPATVVRELALISHVFNIARVEWGMESLRNPAQAMRKPKVMNDRTRTILTGRMALGGADVQTVDEIAVIKHFSESPLLPAIVDVAVDTAMRRGEIAAMRWEHIHAVDGFIHLPRTHTKSGKSREVPISEEALAVLEELPGRSRTGPVFMMRADAITLAFHRALVRAREAYVARSDRSVDDDPFLFDLRFHDLRHEATTRLAKIYDAHELAKVTGHSRMEMLLRYYHPKGKDLAQKRREAALRRPG